MKPCVPLSQARPLWLHSARWELLLFGVFALLLLGLGIGLRDPWPSDEPRFALVAQLMVEHGQWLFPHRGHELYPDKPPVFMWLQALAYLVTGHWRVAFLLPSLAAALGALALVYDLARRLWNHRSALLAAATLLLTIHFTYQMRNAQIDPLLLGWITLANYGLLRHLLLGPSWRWFAAGCFFAGVGVATKGVGVLALLMLIPYLVARRGHWRQLALPTGGWRWAGGLALFFVPILGWLLPMLLVAHADGDPQHAEYVQNILFGQTVHRYATPTGHLHSPLYFLGIIVVDWLPLSLLLPWALPAWWRRLQRRDARFLLPLGWLLFAGALWGVYGLWGYPMLNGDRSAHDVMVQARTIAGPDAGIGLLAWKEQNLLMAQGPVTEFGFLKPWPQQYADAIAWLRQDPARRWIFSLDEAMGHCVDRQRATYVGHANRREWWMFQIGAVTPGCTPGMSANQQADDAP